MGLSLLILIAWQIPTLTERVNDLVNIIDPATETQLTLLLEELERTDSTQVVVLTFPSLDRHDLERFTLDIATQNKIGQKPYNNGALLFVALKERRCRIEVGYGLEERLTDAVCASIIRREMVPHFKAGNYSEGIKKGTEAVVGTIRGIYKADTSNAPPLPVVLFMTLFMIPFVTVSVATLKSKLFVVAIPFQAVPFFMLLMVYSGLLGGMLWGFLATLAIFAGLNGFGWWLLRRMPFKLTPGGGSSLGSTRGWASSRGGWSSGGSSGGFSGGGGSFGGGGASGSW